MQICEHASSTGEILLLKTGIAILIFSIAQFVDQEKSVIIVKRQGVFLYTTSNMCLSVQDPSCPRHQEQPQVDASFELNSAPARDHHLLFNDIMCGI